MPSLRGSAGPEGNRCEPRRSLPRLLPRSHLDSALHALLFSSLTSLAAQTVQLRHTRWILDVTNVSYQVVRSDAKYRAECLSMGGSYGCRTDEPAGCVLPPHRR